MSYQEMSSQQTSSQETSFKRRPLKGRPIKGVLSKRAPYYDSRIPQVHQIQSTAQLEKKPAEISKFKAEKAIYQSLKQRDILGAPRDP